MDDFINIIMDFDKEFRNDILKKLKNKKKLNQFELQYLSLFLKTFKDYQRRKER